MTITTTTINLTRQNFKNLGIDLPKKLVAALEAQRAALSNRDFLAHDVDRELAASVAAALSAGRDPVKDAAVKDALTRRALHQARIGDKLNDYLDQESATLFRTHVDEIMGALQDVVSKADVTLAKVRETLPDVDLVDTDYVNTLRADQMGLWGQARDAAQSVLQVKQTWVLIVQNFRLARISQHDRPLLLADLTAEQLEALGRFPHVEAAMYAGHSLSLATPEEFTRRCADMAAKREKLAARRRSEAAQRPSYLPKVSA